MTNPFLRPARRPAVALALLLGTAGLTGCGETDAPGAPTVPPPSSSTDTGTATGSTSPTAPTSEDTVKPSDGQISPQPTGADGLPTGPVPDDVVERPEVQEAIEAEAERRGVEASEVSVAGYAEVTWRDGSLGCPQPGMMYTQALVPGQQLVLEVDGSLASYHSATSGSFTYCANPQAPLPGGSGSDTR